MYAVAAWVLLQIAEVTFEPLGLPEAWLRTLILVLALGFPFAVVVGFAFDLGASRSARAADAMATAIFVLGTESGMKLVEEKEGMEAVVVDENSNITVSTGLKDRLRVVRPPSQ